MSNGGGSSSSSSNGRGNGVPAIPSASKKMVQSLKEIVNCPDHEIYAMLKDCNMDPNETINRLLSQDTFHEVKSKREKKNQMNENTESRSRGVSSISNRGRSGADRDVGRTSSAQFSSSGSGVTRSKPAYKKDNGTNTIPNSSSGSRMTANNINHRSISHSDPISTENTVQTIGTSDGISLSSKPSSGFQSAWLGASGHVSMADIVKMGKPHAKTSTIPTTVIAASQSPHYAIMSNMLQQNVNHHDPASKVSDIGGKPSMTVDQDHSHEDWPLIEQSPSVSGPSVDEPSGAHVIYADPSSSGLYVDRVNLHPSSELDEVQATERTVTVENHVVDSIRSANALDKVDISLSASCFDDTSFKSKSSYQSQSPALEHQEGIKGSQHVSISDYPDSSSVEDFSEAVTSTAADLHLLSLKKEETCPPSVWEIPAVIIPNHLQVPTADYSHLSFGSFGSGISATFSGSFASKTLKSNSGEASAAADGSSIEHLDSRNAEYYGNEQDRSTSNENVESTSSSQPEVVKLDSAEEATHGHQYPFPSYVPDYAIENTTQKNAAGYSYSQTNSQMQNLMSYSSVMQVSTNSLPSNLLASAIQPVRESDYPYSTFIGTQSMPMKYSSGMSSISGSTISVPEAMNPSISTTPQPTPQTLPSTSIPTVPALPQHLAVHPYSQPTLFTNMITYPFLPQSYTYMPSAFQQAYAANSVFHQSPAAVHSSGIKYPLPQYKNSISVSSLPQPAAIASGYGGFGSSTNIPGSFLLNPAATPPSTTVGYEEVIGSQYKDSNHYGSQQNEASMWVNGPSSRTMSALPSSTYYGFQGQNQHGGIRQSQQPSHYGALGYPHIYHQAGVSQESQQTPSDGILNVSKAPQSQQSHQVWHHSY